MTSPTGLWSASLAIGFSQRRDSAPSVSNLEKVFLFVSLSLLLWKPVTLRKVYIVFLRVFNESFRIFLELCLPVTDLENIIYLIYFARNLHLALSWYSNEIRVLFWRSDKDTYRVPTTCWNKLSKGVFNLRALEVYYTQTSLIWAIGGSSVIARQHRKADLAPGALVIHAHLET